MRRISVIVLLGIAALWMPVAGAESSGDVAMCWYCTTPAQFAMSAVAAFGSEGGDTAPNHVLVVDPADHRSQWVDLVRAADGGSVTARPGNVASQADVAAAVASAGGAPIFIPTCEGVVQLGPSANWAVLRKASAGAAASTDDRTKGAVERGTLVGLSGGVYGMVLCRDPGFATYGTHDQQALTNAIQVAALREAVNMPGAKKVVGELAGPGTLATTAVPMWKPNEVCTIFNNGDSVCYGPSGHGAGHGTGVEIVRHGARIEYGAPGSRAGNGDTWLACGLDGGHVTNCSAVVR